MPSSKSGKSPKSKSKKSKSGSSAASATASSTSPQSSSSTGAPAAPPSSGYLLTCDVPTKQLVTKLNDEKSTDKKFIIEDLDETHLLIEGRAREEILKAVEDWMDENVWSNAERVGENLET